MKKRKKNEKKLNQNRNLKNFTKQNQRFFPKPNCPTLVFSIIPGYLLVHQREGSARGASQEVANFLVLDLWSPHIKREKERERERGNCKS